MLDRMINDSTYRVHELVADARRNYLARMAAVGGAVGPGTAGFVRRLVLTLMAAAFLCVSAGSASAAATPETTTSAVMLSSPPASAPAEAGCWVSGDLVGDSNPAVVGAALCGSTWALMLAAQP